MYSLYLFAHITFPLWGDVISAICIPGQKASKLRSSRQAQLSHLRTKRNIEKFHYIRNYNTHQKNLQSYQCKIQVGPPASQPSPPQCWPSTLTHPTLRPLHPQPSSCDSPLNIPPSNDRELAHSGESSPGTAFLGALKNHSTCKIPGPNTTQTLAMNITSRSSQDQGKKKPSQGKKKIPQLGFFYSNLNKKNLLSQRQIQPETRKFTHTRLDPPRN